MCIMRIVKGEFMEKLRKKDLFNANGEASIVYRQMINGNTTNLNDFNNMKYTWVSSWYRQAMNNFWIPEEINLSQDVKDYRLLSLSEKTAYDKILSFLIFLDSIQTANLPNIANYITANEINLCLTIQAFQEALHSQSYSYMLDSICMPHERNEILYQWQNDPILLERNQFILDLYNEFHESPTPFNLVKTMIANYVLEGIYFYSGFMFFYNLSRVGKMPGSVQEIRYINRDENTHLWLFREMLLELKKEQPELFDEDQNEIYRSMIKESVRQEIKWANYVIGNEIEGLNMSMVESYIKYLGNQRALAIGLGHLFEDHKTMPKTMEWVNQYATANMIKTDFFEARSSAYAKSSALKDDLEDFKM